MSVDDHGSDVDTRDMPVIDTEPGVTTQVLQT
jgi:hypothetical protein